MGERIRSVLFDFDGTIAHTLPVWRAAFREVMLSFGISLSDQEIVTNCFYRDWADVAKDFSIKSEVELASRVISFLESEIGQSELFVGIKDVLQHLVESEVNLGVVTSSPKSVIFSALSKLGIREFFDVVISIDCVDRPKPHADPILKALKQISGTPMQSIMIGDSKNDILAGKAAGCKTALFLPEQHREYYCFETLKSLDPDFVYNDHNVLVSILGY